MQDEMTTQPLPYLTADLAGIGGRIKANLADFRVDEVPLYPAAGEGTHLYARIEKRGLPTPAAVARLATFLGVRPNDIGYAGLKDAAAVATQWVSIEHVEAEALSRFRDRQVRVLETTRHGNKLRPGHLAGNRFTIRIRETTAGPEAAEAVLEVLQRRGVPNYFGAQRFGARGDTAAMGEALIRGELDEFVAIFLGRPMPDDPPDCRTARDEFDAGLYNKALGRWPRHYADQRKALAAYKKSKSPKKGIAAVDKRLRRLFVSAAQSAVFNLVLAERIDSLDRLLPGDLAQKTDTGGVFPVPDPAAEQDRCERFEISPTGPLPGERATLAEGEPGRIERDAIARRGLSPEAFGKVGSLRLKGTRRPLRFPLADVALQAEADEFGPFVELRFLAPSGCYATVVLEEVCKNRQPYLRL